MGGSKSVPPRVNGQRKGPYRLFGGGGDGFQGRLFVIGGPIRSTLSAVPETVAATVHLQGVDVVRETVQQGAGEALRSEELGPFIEGQVGGDQDGPPLVALAEDLERAAPLRWRTGANPNSSMISKFRRASSFYRFSSRRSSRASISSWTRDAAVVNPTDMPLWQAARPVPWATWVLPVPLLPMAMIFYRRTMHAQLVGLSVGRTLETPNSVRRIRFLRQT